MTIRVRSPIHYRYNITLAFGKQNPTMATLAGKETLALGFTDVFKNKAKSIIFLAKFADPSSAESSTLVTAAKFYLSRPHKQLKCLHLPV